MTRKMKDSGIEWIGMIPEGWDRIRLRYLCTIETGNMDTQDADSEGIYPFYVRSPNIEKSSKYTFQGEGIIVAGDGVGAGRVFHHAFGEYGVHQRCYRLSNFNGINPDFLFYYISNMFPNIMDYGSAQSTVPSIRLFMLQDFPVYIPLRTTQPRIVAYLDAKCAEIDALIAAKEKSNALLKEYRQSIIFEAVTKGLDPNAPMKDSGIEWIGMIPEGWDVLKLKSSYSFGKGLSITKADLCEQGLGLISYGQIHSKDNIGASVRGSLIRYLPFDHECLSDNSRVSINDIVFADTSEDLDGCGNCIFIDSENVKYAGYHTIILHPKTKETSRYFGYLFATDAWKTQIRENASGVKVYSITQDMLKNAYLLAPPIETQYQIVSFLDAKCAEIDVLIEANEKTINQLKEYRQSVIFGAVTGKMEV